MSDLSLGAPVFLEVAVGWNDLGVIEVVDILVTQEALETSFDNPQSYALILQLKCGNLHHLFPLWILPVFVQLLNGFDTR